MNSEKHFSLSYIPCCIVILTFLPDICISATEDRIFHLEEDPLRGSVRLQSGFYETSAASCASSCLYNYEDACMSFMFNPSTGLCTPASVIRVGQDTPSVDEGFLYHSFNCDEQKGMNVFTNNSSRVCLGMFEDKKTYSEADAACTTMGTFLASVKTKEKLNTILSIYKNNSVWVGCDDLDQNKEYVWKEDSQLLNNQTISELFYPGDPNNLNQNEHCVSIDNRFNVLIDYDCNQLQSYICEIAIP